MDAPTRAITEYLASRAQAAIEPGVAREVARHLIDSFACALGAMDARPARVARMLAGTASSTLPASVFGLPAATTPEYAAFANTAMVRFLDYNDTGIGGHPSDMIPAVLALAEPLHATGRDVIRAIHAQYEVFAALRLGGLTGYTLRKRHVDQVLTVLGGVSGAGLILGLDLPRMAHAIALAITPNIPLRVTRTGAISDWKGCATAHCAMMSVFAARLAREGMTGPDAPFDGLAGLRDMLQVERLDLGEIGRPRNGLSAIQRTGLKYYPADYNAHASLSALLEIRDQFRLGDVERIDISLHWGGWHAIGGGAGDREEKWNPSTRESADHSMPYLAAVALADGGITLESFAEARIRDPSLRPLMDKIFVQEDPELDREHAGEMPRWPAIVEVHLKDGSRIHRKTGLPKGHPLCPLTDAELEDKFWRMSDGVVPRDRGQRLLDSLWSLDRLDDVGELMRLVRALPVPAQGPAAITVA